MFALADDEAKAAPLWPASKAVARRLLSNTSTPLVQGEFVYSARSSGELVCVNARTGEQLWMTDKVTEPKFGACYSPNRPADNAVWLFTDEGNLILARLSGQGYQELGRTMLLQPTSEFFAHKMAWVPPAFANRCVFARSQQNSFAASRWRPNAEYARRPRRPWPACRLDIARRYTPLGNINAAGDKGADHLPSRADAVQPFLPCVAHAVCHAHENLIAAEHRCSVHVFAQLVLTPTARTRRAGFEDRRLTFLVGREQLSLANQHRRRVERAAEAVFPQFLTRARFPAVGDPRIGRLA